MMKDPLFNYSHKYWKSRMKAALSSDDKIKVAGELAYIGHHILCMASDNNSSHDRYFKLLKRVDRAARSLVLYSEGIDEGYRLCYNWVRTVIAQVALSISVGYRQKESLKESIKIVWNHLGWDPDQDIEPQYNRVRSSLPGEVPVKNGGVAKFIIILDPVGEFPLGSLWKYERKEFELVEVSDNTITLVGEKRPHKVIEITKENLKKEGVRIE